MPGPRRRGRPDDSQCHSTLIPTAYDPDQVRAHPNSMGTEFETDRRTRCARPEGNDERSVSGLDGVLEGRVSGRWALAVNDIEPEFRRFSGLWRFADDTEDQHRARSADLQTSRFATPAQEQRPADRCPADRAQPAGCGQVNDRPAQAWNGAFGRDTRDGSLQVKSDGYGSRSFDESNGRDPGLETLKP